MKYKLLMLLVAFAVLSACSKNETVEVGNNEEVLTDQNSLQKNLDILTIGILGASENEVVKQVIYSEVEKKFDGEYNVLVKTLISECSKQGVDLMYVMQSYINTLGYKENVTDILRSFQNVDGVNYYPQVYIPFFSNEGKLKNSLKSAGNIQLVTDDVEEGENPNGEFVSLKMSGTKAAMEKSIVNEKIALTNPVWVVSLNERVDNNGVYIQDKMMDVVKELKQTKMVRYNVPDVSSVEGWTRGGPEFSVRFIPLSGQVVSLQNFESGRAEVGGNNWKYVNRFILDWDPAALNKYLIVHWIERDGGSSKLLDLKFNVFGFTVTLPIVVGSADDEAGYQAMHYDNLSTPIFNTGWVRWDMQ